MKQKLLNNLRLRAVWLVAMILCAVTGAWADEVTYTITSKNTLSTTGTAPDGSSATIVETYGTSKQMTGGNSQTLTLTGFNGYKVTNITLSMKSNKSAGAGNLSYSVDSGSNYTDIVNTAAFNTSSWYNSWSTEYVNISKDVEIEPAASGFIIKIAATANSLYCESYKLTYEASAASGKITPELSFPENAYNATIGQSFTAPKLNNESGVTVAYSSSNESVATVNSTIGSITLVGEGSTTITASFSGDETYNSASASYTLSVIDPSMVTLWSEDFGDNYSTNSTKYTYELEGSSSGDSYVANGDQLAGGAAPELFIRKSGGSFTATIPLTRIQGDLTLTYKTNNTNLTVSSTTEGVTLSGDTTPKGGQQTSKVTISGITTNSSEIVIVFTNSTGSNVRLDNIMLKGSQLPEGAVADPVITVAESFIGSTTAEITCSTDGVTIYYSYDNENWTEYTEALTITATTTIYAKAVKNEDESSVVSKTTTKTLPTPTVTISASGITNTNVFEGTDAGSLAASVTYNEAAIDGATVTWSGNNDAVATINASTGAVTLVGAGSVTFTATYAGNIDYSEKTATYEMTVTNSDPNVPGTENNPYTVAQARAAIDAGTGVTGVYATGIVSEIVTAYSSQFHNISYNISADGLTTSEQLQAYRGKSYNGDNFTSEDDIQVGDVVVVYGNLTKYSSTYEFAQNNQLVSLVRKPVAPSFSPVAGAVLSGTEVALSTTTEDAVIYYTLDGSVPTTSSTEYTEAIEITEATTIKAIAVKDAVSSDVATAAYTIAAPVATPTFSPAAGTYNAAQTVTISCGTADATIYYSYDNEVWTEYTEALNINESKTVYAKAEKEGSVTSYANAAYTLEIPAITFAEATPKNLTYEAQNYDFSFTGAYTTGSFAVVVCDYEGIAKTYDWFSAELNGDAVRVTLTQNEDTKNSRTAYFKVTADNATSEVFSVVQNEFKADFATLPFEWEGGTASQLTALTGVSANGLGSDYAESNAPYRVKLDGTDDYIQIKTDKQPGTVTIGVKMLGGSNTSSITVKQSADGETFTDVETLSISGSSNAELELETTNAFSASTRYVKLVFTKGSNVGVGPITITTASTDPAIDALPNVDLAEDATSGEIEYTIINPDGINSLTAASDDDWISNINVTATKVTFTTTANMGAERTGTITLTYGEVVKYVTVTQAEHVVMLTYSSTTTITPGKRYIIVSGDGYAMGGQNSNNRAAVAVDINDDVIELASNSGVQGFVIYGPDANGYYSIYDEAEEGYLYAASSGSNHLKTQGTNDANGRWSIEFDGESVATIIAQGANERNWMRYNSSSKIFSCYGSTSNQGDIYLYESEEEAVATNVKVQLNDKGFATYASDKTLDFLNADASFSAWQVTGVSGSTIQFEQIESTVASGKGIMLMGSANAEITINILPAGGETLSGNKLQGITSATEVEADQYFGLKDNQFVKVNAGTIAAGKAVLPTSVLSSGGAGVKSLTFNFNGVPTGVNGVETVDAENARIFNLAGQRLSTPQKGLNIVNGKKVLVK